MDAKSKDDKEIMIKSCTRQWHSQRILGNETSIDT